MSTPAQSLTPGFAGENQDGMLDFTIRGPSCHSVGCFSESPYPRTLSIDIEPDTLSPEKIPMPSRGDRCDVGLQLLPQQQQLNEGDFVTRPIPAILCIAIAVNAAPKIGKSTSIADIRPILSNHCFQCHGPDEDQREADLRLDHRDGAIADLGGHAALVPQQSAKSELIQRVASTDDDLRMPPPEHGEPLDNDRSAC